MTNLDKESLGPGQETHPGKSEWRNRGPDVKASKPKRKSLPLMRASKLPHKLSLPRSLSRIGGTL
jgi:hypothetical protein